MGNPDPLARYADTVLLVVRHTEQVKPLDPEFTTATVMRLAAGGDVPVEDLREDVLAWLVRAAEVGGDNEYEVRRRHIQAGASGAEAAILLSLVGGALGGMASSFTEEAIRAIRYRLAQRTDNLQILDGHLSDLDGMKFAISRAFDIRASDLRLVEERANERRHAAVFEDAAGRAYGVRVASDHVTIRRLRPNEY